MKKRRWIAVMVTAVMTSMGGAIFAQQENPAEPPLADADATETMVRTETSKDLTLMQLLMKGGPLMYPLALCSIVMVAFVIERLINLRRGRILPTETVYRVRTVMNSSSASFKPRELLAALQTERNPLARIVVAGLRKADRSIPEIEKAIEDAGEKECYAMRRNCRGLSVVASIAPLLGLLGTVTGMIRAFMTVAAREEALGRTELLAGGIYEALVTTAVGLTIAIPALVMYYIFVERVDRMISEIDMLAEEFVEKLVSRS